AYRYLYSLLVTQRTSRGRSVRKRREIPADAIRTAGEYQEGLAGVGASKVEQRVDEVRVDDHDPLGRYDVAGVRAVDSKYRCYVESTAGQDKTESRQNQILRRRAVHVGWRGRDDHRSSRSQVY